MSSPSQNLKDAQSLQKELVQIRRHLHSQPELGFHEHETARFVAGKLDSLGLKVQSGIGKTGVVADLGQGQGPTIAIRADMDGLPIEEAIHNKYQSKNPGVMHACGHDAHMSCAIGAASLLTGDFDQQEKQYGARIRMIMQPSEEFADDEGYSGAYRMIEDDVLNGVSAIIGLHMDASIPAGKIGIAPGPVMASAQHFTIQIHGVGGHGAFPENTIDPVVIGSQIVQAIQQIISRRISALEPAIITIGSFHSSSTRGNVISEGVTLRGTLRSFNETVHEKLQEELERACSIAEVMGGRHEISYVHAYPPTVNDVAVTAIVRKAAVDTIGEDNIIHVTPKCWSEDFSMYQKIVPGCFFFLGAERHNDPRTHHTANFDIDESSLYIGSAVLSEAAKRLIPFLSQRS
jgi:amidohydrolase